MADLLADLSSAELTGWLAYLCIDDEVQTQRIAYAIIKAFGGGQKQPAAHDDEDEEVIDTTRPEFTQTFKGFINAPAQRGVPAKRPGQHTDIKFG